VSLAQGDRLRQGAMDVAGQSQNRQS
jgi:hypothetical protein